jgi:hypothetical protein
MGGTDMSERGIRSTVSSLEWIYGVIIALSITEAFMEFASNADSRTPGVQWDRLLSLCSLLLLMVPFYHGMSRYFCEMYDANRLNPYYGLWLLADCVAFTVEAGLFFILAHSLPKSLWLQFNLAVIVLLFWDVLWGAFVWKCRTNVISSWVIVNLCAIPLLTAVVLCLRRSASSWGVSLAFFVILFRAVADYWTSWEFYFPKVQVEGVQPSMET